MVLIRLDLICLVLALLHTAPTAYAMTNGRALTPPQGWTAWNSLVFHPTQKAVESAMRVSLKICNNHSNLLNVLQDTTDGVREPIPPSKPSLSSLGHPIGTSLRRQPLRATSC